MSPISRRAALLSAVVAAGGAAGLAGCKHEQAATPPDSMPPAPSATSPSATPTPSPKPGTMKNILPRWPLTGALLKNAEDAKHAAVAVKVPDNKQEHPQRGINDADIVFVELEGYRDSRGYSQTRLVPVFHSKMPDSVSPVRSIRPVDVALLSPIDAIIGNTGGSGWVVAYVKHNRAHVEGMLSYANTTGTGSYGIDGSRVYTLGGKRYYDRAVVCHPTTLAKQTRRFRSGPPQLYFPYAETPAQVSTAKGKKATRIRVPYKGNDYAMSYTYDAKTKRYLRSMPWGPHVLADGQRVTTDNVLIIKVHQHYGKIYPGSGHDEPLEDTIDAKGTFYYCNQGRMISGTWSKGKPAEPFRFSLADGSTFAMTPGRTFVELPDTKAPVKITG